MTMHAMRCLYPPYLPERRPMQCSQHHDTEHVCASYDSSIFAFRSRIGFTMTSRGVSALLPKPITCPSIPVGFGTGHSLSLVRFLNPSSRGAISAATFGTSSCSASAVTSFRRRLFFGRISSPLSLNCRLSTGQGSMCGIPTTRNETVRHVVKSVEVLRERGWRCGGILARVEVCERCSQRGARWMRS